MSEMNEDQMRQAAIAGAIASYRRTREEGRRFRVGVASAFVRIVTPHEAAVFADPSAAGAAAVHSGISVRSPRDWDGFLPERLWPSLAEQAISRGLLTLPALQSEMPEELESWASSNHADAYLFADGSAMINGELATRADFAEFLRTFHGITIPD